MGLARNAGASGSDCAKSGLELRDLAAGYAGKPVVEHVTLCVRPGQIHCLLGPNGVGKTTVFRTALGLLPPLGGEVSVDGRDMRGMSDRELARHVAYVPQAAEVPFAFSVRDVAVMGRLAHVGSFASPGSADYAVCDRVLQMLEMECLADRLYTELSGGERQMVLIARALTQEPSYLLMDEPTAALDLGNQARVLRAIRGLAARGLGVLMTTHVPDHLDMLGARGTLLLPDGSCLEGDADVLLSEESLSRAYGCPVDVVSVTRGEGRERFCRPRLAI